MNLFVNETHIFLTSLPEELSEHQYDWVWTHADEPLPYEWLSGKVLLKYPPDALIRELMLGVIEHRYKKLTNLTCLVSGLKSTKKNITKDFKIIKAAGGLVLKEDKMLMIYRLKRWDLPKGKLEEGEKRREAAVREVEEECSIRVELVRKLCNTWHHYQIGNNQVLKQTKWYLMQCLDDSRMKPQLEEDIEDIRWMDRTEVEEALKNSYATIKMVIEQYLQA